MFGARYGRVLAAVFSIMEYRPAPEVITALYALAAAFCSEILKRRF